MSLLGTMHRVVNLLVPDVGGLRKFKLNCGEFTGEMSVYKLVIFAKLRRKAQQPVVLCVGRFQMTVELKLADGTTERFGDMRKDTISKAVEFIKSNPDGVWECRRCRHFDNHYNKINITFLELKCGDCRLELRLLQTSTRILNADYITANILAKIQILRRFDSAPSIYTPANFYDDIMLRWFSKDRARDDTSEMPNPENQTFKFSTLVLQYIFNNLEGFDAARDVVVAYVLKYCVPVCIYIDAVTEAELASRNEPT